MNPYAEREFFSFFSLFFQRMFSGFSGGLFSDERQIVVLVFLAISLAFLGTLLVVRQMTMLANALSHTLLVGIVVAFLLLHYLYGELSWEGGLPASGLWIAAWIATSVTTLCTQKLTCRFRIQEDASIAFVFTTLFALGILLVTLYTKNMHLGVEIVMGHIDALGTNDVKNAFQLMLGTGCFFGCGFPLLRMIAFDELFAKSIRLPVQTIHALCMLLVAMASMVAFRAVGVLIFLSLLVGPVLWTRLFVHRLSQIILWSMAYGVGCSLIAIGLSRHILTRFHVPLSTAGLLATFLLLFYLFTVTLCFYYRRKKDRSIRRIGI